jgi:hypothetical protein
LFFGFHENFNFAGSRPMIFACLTQHEVRLKHDVDCVKDNWPSDT